MSPNGKFNSLTVKKLVKLFDHSDRMRRLARGSKFATLFVTPLDPIGLGYYLNIPFLFDKLSVLNDVLFVVSTCVQFIINFALLGVWFLFDKTLDEWRKIDRTRMEKGERERERLGSKKARKYGENIHYKLPLDLFFFF